MLQKYLIQFQQITVTIDDTIVLHGGGDKKFIEDRCVQVSFPPFFGFLKY